MEAKSGAPEFAIDGSALGAMQADRIKIVVTEKGAGVRMRGNMAANVGELSLSSDGKISIGNASGKAGVNIRSKAKVEARKLTSKKRVIVQAGKGITLKFIAADGDVTLSGGSSLLSIAGSVTSLGSVNLTSGAGIATGVLNAGGKVTLTASSGGIAVTGTARAAGGDLTLAAAAGAISAGSACKFRHHQPECRARSEVGGDIFASGNVSVAAKSIDASTIGSGVNIAATNASPSRAIKLNTTGALKLKARSGAISARQLVSAGDLAASGKVSTPAMSRRMAM